MPSIPVGVDSLETRPAGRRVADVVAAIVVLDDGKVDPGGRLVVLVLLRNGHRGCGEHDQK